VLGIHGIFGADPDPRFVPLANGMDPDQTPDPTPFFGDFNDANFFFFFHIFFLATYPQPHYL
jgi:hypothetical protein